MTVLKNQYCAVDIDETGKLKNALLHCYQLFVCEGVNFQNLQGV